MIPDWLHLLAIASLAFAAASALVVAIDLFRRPQPMAIMNVVWPVTMLFGSIAWLAFYLRRGRAPERGRKQRSEQDPPFAVQVAKATSHCGAGCTLGDLVAEAWAVGTPSVLAFFGCPGVFGDRMFAAWGLDFVFAYLLGIVFQYFTIAPMRHLGLAAGIWAAIKADTLSLLSWQVGMYGGMAIAKFAIFRPLFGVDLDAKMPEFWLSMQLAMWLGFACSAPVNAWLLRRGWKEAM